MKKIVVTMFVFGALVSAPIAQADHGDGGYLDSGSYDELTQVVDPDGTQGNFDDDGYQGASSGAEGACYVPGWTDC